MIAACCCYFVVLSLLLLPLFIAVLPLMLRAAFVPVTACCFCYYMLFLVAFCIAASSVWFVGSKKCGGSNG